MSFLPRHISNGDDGEFVLDFQSPNLNGRNSSHKNSLNAKPAAGPPAYQDLYHLLKVPDKDPDIEATFLEYEKTVQDKNNGFFWKNNPPTPLSSSSSSSSSSINQSTRSTAAIPTIVHAVQTNDHEDDALYMQHWPTPLVTTPLSSKTKVDENSMMDTLSKNEQASTTMNKYSRSGIVSKINIPGQYVRGSEKWNKAVDIVKDIESEIDLMCVKTSSSSSSSSTSASASTTEVLHKQWMQFQRNMHANPFHYIALETVEALMENTGFCRMHAELQLLCHKLRYAQKTTTIKMFRKKLAAEMSLYVYQTCIVRDNIILQCATSAKPPESFNKKEQNLREGRKLMKIGIQETIALNINRMRQNLYGLAPFEDSQHLKEIFLSDKIESDEVYNFQDPVEVRSWITFQLTINIVFRSNEVIEKPSLRKTLRSKTKTELLEWMESRAGEKWVPINFYYHMRNQNEKLLRSMESSRT